jgi:phosphatidylinositol alpha 1,6-mannosyltransferase
MLVLHVGRLAVEKDVDTLVAAFRLARERLGEAAAFCVAGDGPRAPAVRAALPFARHLGFLDRETLADLYADADLFVFPSQTETCGLVALEALASGVPVIGADAGGIPESLRHGLTGFLVPAGDAEAFAARIVELANDGAQRAAMHEAARAFAVGRDWRRELDELEAAYESVKCTTTAAAAPSAWPTSTSVA